MQVFYASEISEKTALLTEEESRHVLRVLRKQVGDIVQCTDGKGQMAVGVIKNIAGKHCRIELTNLKRISPPPYELHLVVSPTKNIARMEWMVEKCTELGLSSLQVIWTRHSERKKIKTERLLKKGLAAMKQSQQAHLPAFPEPLSLSEYLQTQLEGRLWVAHCRESDQKQNWLKDVPAEGKHYVFIGPEGDFSREEIKLLSKAGATLVHLGKRRLRTETAAMLCAATLYQKSSAYD
jgi:16S rRNA (uracil1498-N3)-methyltransferase